MARFSEDLPEISVLSDGATKINIPGNVIDRCKIGDDFAIYNHASGSLLVLNSSAYAFFSALELGVSSLEIASEIASRTGIPQSAILGDIDLQIDQWVEAGLLEEESEAPEPQLKPDCHLHTGFNAGGENLTFSSNDSETFGLFCDLLAPLASQKGHRELSMVKGGKGYSVWFEDEHLIGPDEFSAARHTAIAKIARIAGNENTGCVFHASAINYKSKVFLISGRSGAGKSTLTATMAANEAIYLADDLVAMDQSMKFLFPNPVRLNVKSRSFGLIGKLYPDLQSAKDWNVAGTNTRYVQPANLPDFDSCPVNYVVFPKFDPYAPVGMKRLDSRDTLMRLAQNGIDLSRKPGTINQLVDFINATPGYELNYSSSDEASQMVNKIISANDTA